MAAEKPVEVFVASKIAIRLFGAFGSRETQSRAKQLTIFMYPKCLSATDGVAPRLSGTWLGEMLFRSSALIYAASKIRTRF